MMSRNQMTGMSHHSPWSVLLDTLICTGLTQGDHYSPEYTIPVQLNEEGELVGTYYAVIVATETAADGNYNRNMQPKQAIQHGISERTLLLDLDVDSDNNNRNSAKISRRPRRRVRYSLSTQTMMTATMILTTAIPRSMARTTRPGIWPRWWHRLIRAGKVTAWKSCLRHPITPTYEFLRPMGRILSAPSRATITSVSCSRPTSQTVS